MDIPIPATHANSNPVHCRRHSRGCYSVLSVIKDQHRVHTQGARGGACAHHLGHANMSSITAETHPG